MSTLDPLILVVEDEDQMRKFMRASLMARQYRVLEAARADEAMRLLTSHNPALLLLDLGLPDGDGIELTRLIREFSRVPIIVVSARGREDDKVTALDVGADDYLTKPFGVNELLARIRVALRHAQQQHDGVEVDAYTLGSLAVDVGKREVRRAGELVHLTPIEYRILLLFLRNLGKVLTHRQILKEVWGPAYATRVHYVRVHIAELRKKIEEDASRPMLLLTEPSVGYRLREPS